MNGNSNHIRLFVAAIVVALLLAMFGRALFTGESFAFRDTANFYFPLFEWEAREWGAGRIPLWNPLDNLGSPVFADATSSVLYPGKILFALPFSFETRFDLYVVAHVLLAAWSAFSAARHWKCGIAASGICAVSYAFGGHVLSQHSNVVYLVSAAWLPLAVRFADSMLVERCRGHAVAWGAVVGLMVLGGDPQGAYHAGLLAVFQMIGLWRRERSSPPALPPHRSPRIAVLAVAGLTAFGISAVQVLPSWQWSRQSDRVRYESPRSIYEVEKLLRSAEQFPGKEIAAGLFGKPRPSTHAEQIYYYSIGPWRFAEMAWPNVYGRMYPVHQRWSTLIPAEGGLWAPTLYFGVVGVLAAATFRFRHAVPQDRWAFWMSLIGVVASTGWFGLGWVIHEICLAISPRVESNLALGQPTGGLYWVFVVFLPGYAYFRYPAKWFVTAALGMSLLAARGVDQFAVDTRPAHRKFVWFGIASLVFAIMTVAARSYLVNQFSGGPANAIFGPLEAAGAWRDLCTAFVHAMLVAACCILVFRVSRLQRIASPPVWLLAIAAVDLFVANRWLIATAPHAPHAFEASIPHQPPRRIAHDRSANWVPKEWSVSSDTHRLSDVMAWEETSLLYKYHLRRGVAALETAPSIQSARLQAFQRLVRNTNLPLQTRAQLMGMVGVEQMVLPPRAADSSECPTVDVSAAGELPVKPRARIVQHAIPVDPWSPSWRSVQEQTDFIWLDRSEGGLRVRILNDRQFVTSGPPADPRENIIQIIRYEPQRVEVEAQVFQSGCLVISDFYDTGWKATIQSMEHQGSATQVSILPVNGLLRGMWIPKGHYRVVMQYRPWSFFIGAWISAVSLVLLLLAGLRRGVDRLRTARPVSPPA